jgi:hypothetical protein
VRAAYGASDTYLLHATDLPHGGGIARGEEWPAGVDVAASDLRTGLDGEEGADAETQSLVRALALGKRKQLLVVAAVDPGTGGLRAVWQAPVVDTAQ